MVAASLVTLNTGGSRLRVAGHAGGSTTQLSDDLRRLEEHLPAHLVASMVERAHTLQAAAQRDPTGPATQELESLKQDVRDILTGDVLEQAESLRDDVQRARRAMAEVRAKGPAQH